MSAVGYQSDSQLLVDACLARLRVDARLDDDPVLPTIDLLPDVDLIDDDANDDFIEVDESELVIECRSVKDLPSAASIVREAVRANASRSERSQKEVPTLRKMRSASPSTKVARWPVVLCALVATYFGTLAFMKSPLGAKPEVQHAVKVSRAHVTSFVQTTVQTTKSIVRR